MSDEQAHFETLAIRTQTSVSAEREHSVPLYLTSSFRFDDAEHARALFTEEVAGNVYSRYANPNTDEFVRKLCLLEGGEDGIATASGMSAVFTAIAARVSSGDHVLASRALFGSTHQIFTRILPKWGVSSDYADAADPSSWERLVRPSTKLIFIETPSNPGLELVDLRWLGDFAAQGFLKPLDEYVAKWGVPFDDFYETYQLNYGHWADKGILGIPFDCDIQMVHIRPSIFKKIGIDADRVKSIETYDDMIRIAPELNKAEKGVNGIGMMCGRGFWATYTWQHIAAQYGLELFNENWEPIFNGDAGVVFLVQFSRIHI